MRIPGFRILGKPCFIGFDLSQVSNLDHSSAQGAPAHHSACFSPSIPDDNKVFKRLDLQTSFPSSIIDRAVSKQPYN